MHALVVDDSRTTRKILCSIVDELGFAVTEAGDGIEALQVIEPLGHVDLMLVDWNMPNMNGIEFIKEVRRRGTWDGARIMMVTTEAELDQVLQAIEAGANEYIMKPFSREALFEKLALLGFEPERQ